MMNKGISHKSVIAGGIIILSGLLASGCGRKKEVIGEKEMVDLITDLKLAEAYSNNQLGGPHHAENREDLANGVLAEHGVTREQLDSTLGWYGRNLDKYAELYEKVDKRLVEKRKQLMKDAGESELAKGGDNLWPYGLNGVISSLGTTDGWILSINDPELNSGDRLKWSMHLKDMTMPMTGVLGVEYADGTAEAVSSHFTNRQHVELSLQTDTSKTVSRVYGTMRRKTQETQPLFVDSIRLHRLPFDSLEYTRFRSQKKYGYPVRITQEDRKQKAMRDSLRQDSIKQAAKLRRDSIELSREKVPESQSESNNRIKPLKPGKDIAPTSTGKRVSKAVKSESVIQKVK